MADQVQELMIGALKAAHTPLNQAVQQLKDRMGSINTIVTQMDGLVNDMFARGIDFPLALGSPLMMQLSDASKIFKGAIAVYDLTIILLTVQVTNLLNRVGHLLEQQPLPNEGDLPIRRLQYLIGQLVESVHIAFRGYNAIVAALNGANQSLITTANPFMAPHSQFLRDLNLSSVALVQAHESVNPAKHLYLQAREVMSQANMLNDAIVDL